MVWKTVAQNDPGDSTHFGGNDVNKISNIFSASSAVDTIDFDSQVTFRDTRLKLRGSSASNVVTIRNNVISGLTDLVIPNPVGSTSQIMLTDSCLATITNKTINAWDNTLNGFDTFPSVRKTGVIPCGAVTGGGAAGVGLLSGFVDHPTLPTRGQDTTYGSYWRYATGTTANTLTGIRMPARWILKEWLPYFRCKTRCASTTTNTRQYVGLTYETTPVTTDTPIDNNESAVLVGWRTSDANIQVFLNSGTGTGTSTPSVINTGVPKSTAVRQYEIVFTSASSCRVRVLDGNATTALYTSPSLTTNLPADILSCSMTMSDTTTTSNNYDAFFMEVSHAL